MSHLVHTPKPLKYLALNCLVLISLLWLPAIASASETGINFQRLIRYAEFSSASYQTPADIRKFCSAQQYHFDHYGNIPSMEVAYFIATDDRSKTQIISVRGTSNIENALVDIALKLTPDKQTGISLHNGFASAARAIFSEIKPFLKPGYRINTTGHSLGGAVALVLAMYLDVHDYPVGRIITFGQPKVTNFSGAARFDKLDVTRVVTPKDLVPLVPPFDPVDYKDIGIYWHLGTEVVLNSNGTYSLLEGLNSMLRATKFTQEPLTENNLQNHRMTLYLSLLNKVAKNPRQVPFKNDLNIFNLFGQ